MAKRYTVGTKETLKRIAGEQMGDEGLAGVLADYNGIVGRRQVVPGQVIEIPSRKDLAPSRAARPRAAAWPAPPGGLRGVLETFGNLYDYVRDDGSVDPRWESENMVLVPLPFALPLDWDTTKSVTRVRCHKRLAPLYQELFGQLVAQNLKNTLKTYGGAYQYRAKRNGAKPSTHSWGIAIDFNVRTNQMGTNGDMDPRLVALMEGFGFVWGGRWTGRGKDPMHFQYCTGY